MTFKKAIKLMIEDGDLEKVINFAKGKDKREARKFYEFCKVNDIEKVPAIILLQMIKSTSVLQDIICYMWTKDKDVL